MNHIYHLPEHQTLRDQMQRFLEREVEPYGLEWEKAGKVPREALRKMGEAGFFGLMYESEYGGAEADALTNLVFAEALSQSTFAGFIVSVLVHTDMASPHLHHAGTKAQKAKYMPGIIAGDTICAVAMTEPGAGSDLQGIRTRAVRDGDHYVLNGSKIFITNGGSASLLMLVTRTDPTERKRGLSLIMVETENLAGYRVGRVLDKMGMPAQDTAELFFEDVRVPADCLLGSEEGQGMYQLMGDLPYERLVIALCGVGAMEGAVAATSQYVKERKAFGQVIGTMQNIRFKLAESATVTRIARVFVDDCIQKLLVGKLDNETASMAKYWVTDAQQQVIDECVQMHGGYGYMNEYLVCRMFADSRVQRIYGGTNEIMKELISRSV